jgi:hypothetical protein
MNGGSTGAESPYTGLAAKIRPEGSSYAQAVAAERAARQPIVRVAFTRGTFILRRCVEPCRVLVDGQSVGELSSKNKVEATLAPGRHTLQIKRGWLSSNLVELTVKNGDIAQYVCTGHHSLLDLIFGMPAFYALFFPRRFFRLRSFRP